MEKAKAYDLPLRLFHWFFAGLFIFSFSIGKFIDDDSALHVYHMLSGMLMVILVLLRIIWGFTGTKTSRFSSFKLSPGELKIYLRSVISGKTLRYFGHNPASSYAGLAMLFLSLGVALSGSMMVLGISKHFFEEVHELFAHLFLGVVIIHVAGVVFHQYRHRDGMIYSMIHGNKNEMEGVNEISSTHPVVAAILLLVMVSGGIFLTNGLDSKTGRLSLFGAQIQLGEKENAKHGHDDEHEEDDDDDD